MLTYLRVKCHYVYKRLSSASTKIESGGWGEDKRERRRNMTKYKQPRNLGTGTMTFIVLSLNWFLQVCDFSR